MKYKLRVLIACEESQTMCMAFRSLGHHAYSADIQKCSGIHPEWHILGDVIPLIDNDCPHVFYTQDGKRHIVGDWDLLIAHPPCTYLSRAGGYLLKNKDGTPNIERINLMRDAAYFFMRFYMSNVPYIAIENPMPLKAANLPTPSTYVQPYMFGDPFSKLTCFWLRNLPPLMSTTFASSHQPYIGGGSGRPGFSTCSKKMRSKTFPSIAKAAAKQWSDFILNDRGLL